MTTIITTMISRPLFALDARHAVLRFELGRARAFPPDTGHRRPWYGQTVTDTLAARIRARAAELHYDRLDADAQRALRREIADEFGTIVPNVVSALKHTGRSGRRRVLTDEHRCPTCEQVLLSLKAREAVERNTAKPSKRRTK